jgi:hypothetical protein
MPSISNARKSRGRPAIGAKPLTLRLPPDHLARLDAWIVSLPDPKPTRPEALRRLMDKALAGETALRPVPQ